MDHLMNNKKTIKAWAVFDWANSAYALVIATAIFPIYFIENTPDFISMGSLKMSNTSLYSYSIAFSYLIIAILSPFLSGIADYSGKKMFFLKLFTILGSLACIALYFFNGAADLWLGTAAFILATIGFAGAIVFYNAYLPEIVTEEHYDKVSAKGYAYGYVGSVILLIAILFMVLKPAYFGITDPRLPSKIGFVMVGLWWLGFAQYSFKHLPQDKKGRFEKKVLYKGVKELKASFKELRSNDNTKRFLLSYFLYSSGVNTVIYVATIFAKEELNFDTKELILIVLILQLVAIGGAFLFAQLSKHSGNKISLSLMIIIWIIVCVLAFYVQGKINFYLIAVLVGMVMGGIQSLSRSSYSKLIENDDNSADLASHFSFYDVLTKLSIIAGTFGFGIINQLTGSLRYSVLFLALFFILGLVALITVNFEYNNKVVPVS